jgi:hypothetical protein
VVIIAALLALPGCDSSGIGRGGDDVLPSERPFGTVKGVAFDGLIIGADVTIYSFTKSGKGESLARGRSDETGQYSIELRAASQPILIEVTGGRYVEEASGRSVPLSQGQFLYAVTNYVSGAAVQMSATYYSTLATALAEHLAAGGEDVAAAITQANTRAGAILGWDLATVTPVDVTNIANAAAFLTKEIEYGFFTAAVSSWTLAASTINQTEPHAIHNSITFAQRAYEDLRADGKLDGRGNNRLSVGTILLGPEVYRHQLAVHMLKMARDVRNKSGISADTLVDSASRLNDSTDPIFAEAPLLPLDENAPVIKSISPPAGALVTGKFEASATLTSPTALTLVEFFVDGAYLGAAADVRAPALTIDSAPYADGEHTLEIRAKNLYGASAAAKQKIVFDNNPPLVDSLKPAAGSVLRGNFEMSATISDAVGIAKVAWYIDGTSHSTADTATVSSTDFADGPHTLTISVIDHVGHETRRSVAVTFDNAPPVLSATPSTSGGLQPDPTVRCVASGTVADAVSGIRSVAVGDQAIHLSGSQWSYSFIGNKHANPFLVTATDVAGNATSVSVSFKVSIEPGPNNQWLVSCKIL